MTTRLAGTRKLNQRDIYDDDIEKARYYAKSSCNNGTDKNLIFGQFFSVKSQWPSKNTMITMNIDQIIVP